MNEAESISPPILFFLRKGWRADCPACVGSKFTCDAHFIEPAAICRNCEYFDGGGMGQDGVPINFEGDCLNRHSSPRFTTNQDQKCKGFWPCSTRWPDRS